MSINLVSSNDRITLLGIQPNTYLPLPKFNRMFKVVTKAKYKENAVIKDGVFLDLNDASR